MFPDSYHELMFFLPYRVDLELLRTPFVTVLICIVCLLVFQMQMKNAIKIDEMTYVYCQGANSRIFQMTLKKLDFSKVRYTAGSRCEELLRELLVADDVDAKINEVVANARLFEGLSRADSQAYAADVIREQFRSYQRRVPADLTGRLEYDPASWNPLTMISSAFAHASWAHVIGNLFFFFAFAATVEIIVGPLIFAALVTAIALFSGVFFSIFELAAIEVSSTVGLSGVVMGMMALFAFFLPHGRIRCLLWILVFIRRVPVPAWLIVLAFVGLDVYELFTTEELGGVNLIAHISGAACGYLAGVIFFQERQRKVREMFATAH